MSSLAARPSASNPLTQVTSALPEGAARWISIGARAIGAALALYIAFDQSYDRTQVLCAAIIVATLATLPPLTRMASFASGLGSGILFFSGSLLWAQAAGKGMLVVGCIAVAATLIDAHQRKGDIGTPIAGFFFGLGATLAAVTAILFTVNG